VSGMAVRLAEWETVSPVPGSRTEALNLGDDSSVRDLARRLAEDRLLEVVELRAGLAVRSTSFVGRVRLGEIDITVIPKLGPDSLLKLLRYAYGLRDLKLLPLTIQPTQVLGLQDILVWQLIEEVKELLARGLKRAYVRQDEPLVSPRGRIDFQRLVANGAVAVETLPCIHHRRDENTLINRALLSGLRLVASLDVDRSLRVRAERLTGFLGDSVLPIRLDHHAFRRLEGKMDRTTKPYEPALSIIRILAESGGLSLSGRTGPRLPGFLFDMNRFFQALVGKFLADNLQDLTIHLEHRLKGVLAYVPGWNPRNHQAPVPRPDFLVTKNQRAVAILDSKYRDLWENPVPRDMLYQLAVYAMIHECGMSAILYPTTNAQATEARIEVRDPQSGGRRALVTLRPVRIDRLEAAIYSTATATVLRERRSLAREMVFGQIE
jgi:5-methylcytosine-specific restriction enzyme subunit McrC